MSNDYTQAPATLMLATNCVCCGRALVDAVSVELGIGPECRSQAFPEGVDDDDRELANEHVHHAAIAAQNGHATKVVEYAELIRKLGFVGLADKVEKRFKKGAALTAQKADIVILEDGADLLVVTPYRRSKSDEFVEAWRGIKGRRWDYKTKKNRIPKTQRPALWDLLKTYFPNKWGVGPKGSFRVPHMAKVEIPNAPLPPELDQPELDFTEQQLEEQPELDGESAAHAAEFEQYGY